MVIMIPQLFVSGGIHHSIIRTHPFEGADGRGGKKSPLVSWQLVEEVGARGVVRLDVFVGNSETDCGGVAVTTTDTWTTCFTKSVLATNPIISPITPVIEATSPTKPIVAKSPLLVPSSLLLCSAATIVANAPIRAARIALIALIKAIINPSDICITPSSLATAQFITTTMLGEAG